LTGLSRRGIADLTILGLSALWGCTFVVIKQALHDASPLVYMTLRFGVGAALLLPLVPRGALRGPAGAGALRGGLIVGLCLASGFAFQTYGLVYTTPARSAFITGVNVIFTPLLAVLLGMRRPRTSTLAGAALAMVGMYLLTDPMAEGGGMGRGEWLTLVCAVCFAGHLLSLDHFTRKHDQAAIAFLQVALVAVGAGLALPWAETIRFNPTPRLIAALAITSVLGTAFAFYVFSRVQSWTTPARAAVLFSSEPVFAALTSWVVEGERLSAVATGGAGLILAGILTAELNLLGGRDSPAVIS
jgi:drug/metabolite transporter (DMT)-like permease